MATFAGCDRESTITRLPDMPASAPELASMGLAPPSDDELNPRLMRRFGAIVKPAPPSNPALVQLGRELFYEPRLSSTGRISCNTCHPLDKYGTTPTRISVGVNGRVGRRNAPSVYNAVGQFRLFWDGRAPTLEEQALEPLRNPNEMDMSADNLIRRLEAIPGYVEQFRKAFPRERHPVTLAHVGEAMAAFERGLITPSRWDRYINGDSSALSKTEKNGARLFANLGCLVCHAGPYVGGTMFERLGVFAAWPDQSDQGRFEVTRSEADRMVFKVPSLRNVARTAPYFHDGGTVSLGSAVQQMARYQTKTELTATETDLIVAWLDSLTGQIPAEYIREPVLPPSVRP